MGYLLGSISSAILLSRAKYFVDIRKRGSGNAGAANMTRVHGLGAGLTTLGIDSVGNVRGCESLYDERFIEGNLRRRSLREIWEDENAFVYNRRFEPRMLTGKCASCEMGEYCGGGCRSYNFFAGGKLYESPLCPRQS